MRLASPYRLMAAFMAVLLVFSSALPVVQHVCAMALGGNAAAHHGMMHEMPASSADAPVMHHGMMHEMPAQKAPCCCNDRVRAHAPEASPTPAGTACAAPMGAREGGDCCTIQATPPLRDDVVLSASPPRADAPLVAVTPPCPAETAVQSALPFSDTGPPPPSVPVYLACSVLLI